MPSKPKENKVIAQNRKAWHEYFVEEALEAGVELRGTEVKSMRMGKCNLKDCYATVQNGELLAYGMHVSPYEKGNVFNTDPLRPKRLLLHKAEIRRLGQQVLKQGVTLVPLKIYLKGNLMKVELGVCRGKKLYDKRDDAAKRDAERDIDRALRGRNRSGRQDDD